MPWALQTFYREVTLVRQLSCLFHWLRPERNLYILEWVSQKGDMESDPKSDQEKYLWEYNLRLGKGQSASVLLTRFFYLVIDDKVFLFKVINDSCKQVHFLKEQILGLWGFPGGLVVKTLFFPRRHGWIPHQGIRSHTSQSIAKKKKNQEFYCQMPPFFPSRSSRKLWWQLHNMPGGRNRASEVLHALWQNRCFVFSA